MIKQRVAKGLLSVIFLISLCFLLGQVAFAHPGRTDSSGGHYDCDTGDYHYHHGYDAHYHSNGTCPYDFDDKTGQNSGSSSGSSSSAKTTTKPNTTGYYSSYFLQEPSTRQPYKPSEKDTDTELDPIIIFAYIALLLFCAVPTVAIVFLIHRSNKSERTYNQYKATIATQNKEKSQADDAQLCREKTQQPVSISTNKTADSISTTTPSLAKEPSPSFTDQYRQQKLALLQKLSSDDIFSELTDPLQAVSFDDGLQITYANRTPDRYYGEYTVYLTNRGRNFHKKRGCCGATVQWPAFRSSESRFYNHRLCSKCWEFQLIEIYDELFSPHWYTLYKELQREMQRYNITADDIRAYRKEQQVQANENKN